MTPAPIIRALVTVARVEELRHIIGVAYREARENLVAAVVASKPATFRLQETFLNADGDYDTPHWDEHAEYRTQALISPDELNEHLTREGRWAVMSYPTAEEPRHLCRRVIDVTWHEPNKDTP